MKPFGCHVTILNTLDNLGKFEGKANERFLVGYSVNCKALRVFNSKTRRVEENLHIKFLENKPNVEGRGLKWLFDIDSQTNSMNYELVTAGNQTNKDAGIEINANAGKARQEKASNHEYVLLPFMPLRRDRSKVVLAFTSFFFFCISSVVKGNSQLALQDKGVIDSGCSRHMTWNMSYLSDFKELNGGYVSFGGNPKGGKITGKGKIKTGKLDFNNVYFVKELKFNLFSVSQMCDKKNSVLFTDTECFVLSSDFKLPDESQVLLRVPRENNMYNVNLKNIVPSGDLTCLFAKATLDESNLWHRRLAHVNFKTINKLVKGNLVKGLPTKVFENDHTCIACKKGKQHRASCKTKPVSSVDQPLFRLHMDLFGPTFVKTLNKKSYCLVITDDYSRFTWMSRDVLTVGSTMRIPLLYRGEYSQWSERFMNYLEEQTDVEIMINSIKNSDQPLPHVTQVSIPRTTSTKQPPLKDKSMWSDQEKKIQKIDRLARSLLIQGLPNDIYSLINNNKTAKDLWDALARHMLGSKYGNVNDAMKYKKKAVVITSDPLSLVAEQTKVSKRKEKVVVSLEYEGSDDDLKKITALLAKAFNRKKFYSKPINNNLRTSSATSLVNKKQEKDIFAKDSKKAKVKDLEYYKTKMLLAKKDKDEQVLLAEDHAWMESSSDSDQ
nr:putative ribonuclease H-like domain-containing protein [Tanacetum cinerariifolium]